MDRGYGNTGQDEQRYSNEGYGSDRSMRNSGSDQDRGYGQQDRDDRDSGRYGGGWDR